MNTAEAKDKYAQASNLYKAHDYSGALALLDEVYEQFPENKDVIAARSRILAAFRQESGQQDLELKPHRGEYDSRDEAEQELERWKKCLPSSSRRARRTYQAEGRLSMTAGLSLLVAAILGGTIAVAIGMLVGVVLGYFLGFALPFCTAPGLGHGSRVLFSYVLIFVVHLIHFSSMGAVSGGIVAAASRASKTRSANALYFFAFLSAIACIISVVGFQHFVSSDLENAVLYIFTWGPSHGVFDVIYAWLLPACAIPVASLLVARAGFKSFLFCDKCKCYLKREKTPSSIPCESIGSVVTALREGDMVSLAGLLSCEQRQPGDAYFDLHVCPNCRNGLLELTVVFQARWSELQKQAPHRVSCESVPKQLSLKHSWCVASVALTPDDTHQLSALHADSA